MSGTGFVVVIVVVVAVLLLLGLFLREQGRRRRLQSRFGPEYQRVVADADNRRQAERELADRERRHAELPIRPVAADARERYAQKWQAVQERFVDTPVEAVGAADRLVTALMGERGYPTGDYRQRVADLSVEHATVLDDYRSARDISGRAGAGTATTEELRQAMVHYRSLFDELLGGARHRAR